MTAYAIAHLRAVRMGAEIAEYLRRIDETLAPYGGRYRVHGGPVDVLEGAWSGDLVIIEFPDRARARSWYDSIAYCRIRRLRTDNAEGEVVLVDGVDDNHRAVDILG